MPDKLPAVLKMPPHKPYKDLGAMSATIVQPSELKPLPKKAKDINTTISAGESVSNESSINVESIIPMIIGSLRDLAVEKPSRTILSETSPAHKLPKNPNRAGIEAIIPTLIKDIPFTSIKYSGNQVKKKKVMAFIQY